LDLLGNKWSILVLRELFGGNRRMHELLKALPGISTKTLTQRLRELEAQGLVERRIVALRQFPFPIILWMPQETFVELMHQEPNFYHWCKCSSRFH